MNPWNRPGRRLFRSADFIWAGGFLLISLLLLLLLHPASQGSYACIYQENQLLATYSLQEDQTFSLPECPAITFEIQNGSIRFLSSDCPDQTCVRTGFISHGSQYAVCLPHRISVQIIEKEAPDAVTH